MLGFAALLAAAAAGPAASGKAPSLRLVSVSPPTVHASGFLPRESVRVTLAIRTPLARKTGRAGADGRLTLRLATLVAVEPCRGTLVVTAVGVASKRVAVWKRECRTPDPLPSG